MSIDAGIFHDRHNDARWNRKVGGGGIREFKLRAAPAEAATGGVL